MKKLQQDFLLAILTALFFSAFIYFEYFGITLKLINTLFGIAALALLLYIPKRAILIAGFFIGLFWFYWIGNSFKYQGVGYMEPFITLGFGIIYLIFFAPLALTNKPYIRALLLFGLSFVEPFGWNWLKPELLFVESYIGIYKYQFAILLAALSLPSLISNKKYRYAPLVLLIAALNFGYPPQEDAPLKIKLVQTHIPQEKKWTREQLYPTVSLIFSEIQKATREGYDLVVLPESVFPLFLNQEPRLIATLKKASHKIAIVTGALLLEDGKHYNVAYKFEDGEFQIAKKLVLVPFGEYIPLPKFARKFINDTFFSGASDFVTAKAPTDFIIKGVKFRNAICYEATTDAIYENHPKYLIAISNNAWFTPSIEPTLQNLLLRYFARKYGVTIYHATNDEGTGVVK
jgi:apolipoprotein N-acyltransferase